MANTTIISNQWEKGFFEIECSSACCYAMTLPCCAMAEARHKLDDSDLCCNLWCLSPIVGTFLIKSAYGIEQDMCIVDYLKWLFCAPCYANQVYNTVLKRGNPTTDGGKFKNTVSLSDGFCPEEWDTCCFACWCPWIQDSLELQAHMNMPWWMGLCFINPCMAQQLQRYQYRFGGNDTEGVGKFLASCWCCAACTSCCPCCAPCCLVLSPFMCGPCVWGAHAVRQSYISAEIKKLDPSVFSDRYLVRNAGYKAEYTAVATGVSVQDTIQSQPVEVTGVVVAVPSGIEYSLGSAPVQPTGIEMKQV